MNHIAPQPEPLIREIPLSCLALAPENVRKTPPDEAAEAQLIASIKSHGLLKNLVVRPDEPAADGAKRFAVVAGGRRLAALIALVKEGWFNALHPVPCKIAANGNAGELSLAETLVGTTKGRGRYDRHTRRDQPKKDIWLRPLRKDWRRTLNR